MQIDGLQILAPARNRRRTSLRKGIEIVLFADKINQMMAVIDTNIYTRDIKNVHER